jgi:hypothetical protein
LTLPDHPPAWIFRAGPPRFEPAEDSRRARYLVPKFPVGSLRQPPSFARGRMFEPVEYVALDRRVYAAPDYGHAVLYAATEETADLHAILDLAVFAIDFLALLISGIQKGST